MLPDLLLPSGFTTSEWVLAWFNIALSLQA